MKALALLSGGFDSPVAIYLMKNKLEIDAIHFSLEPLTDNEAEKKSKKVAKILGVRKLYVVNHTKQQTEIAEKCDHRYYHILVRRLMLRTAEKLAKKLKCRFLIDGCSIGQVSSQTLSNLSVISKAVDVEILRPLLCYDKQEIIDLAKEIGTYEISKGPETCNIIGPKNPATKSNLNFIQREESKVDVDEMISDAIEDIKEIKV